MGRKQKKRGNHQKSTLMKPEHTKNAVENIARNGLSGASKGEAAAESEAVQPEAVQSEAVQSEVFTDESLLRDVIVEAARDCTKRKFGTWVAVVEAVERYEAFLEEKD